MVKLVKHSIIIRSWEEGKGQRVKGIEQNRQRLNCKQQRHSDTTFRSQKVYVDQIS